MKTSNNHKYWNFVFILNLFTIFGVKMKKKKFNIRIGLILCPKKLLFFVAIAYILMNTSCVRYRNYVYLQEKSTTDTTYYTTSYTDYKLKSGDIMYINITSNDKVVTEIFGDQNRGGQNNSGNLQNSNYYITGYKVNQKGAIEVPLIGSFDVAGYSIMETEDMIIRATKAKFPNATAKVRLVNFKITMIGEVGKEGTMMVQDDRINIIEAIHNAGGISTAGNRKNVQILRATETGYKRFSVDLTDHKLIESEEFYLYPDDIVYVLPVRTKPLRIAISDYSMVLGTITTTIAFALTIINLTKKP